MELKEKIAELNQKHFNQKLNKIFFKHNKSNWGSCSSDKRITLSYYLCQLPPHLIDYVLLHELLHTKYLHHGKEFWAEMEKLLPGTIEFKRDIKAHKPRVEPITLA